jgi:hypothetical protein
VLKAATDNQRRASDQLDTANASRRQTQAAELLKLYECSRDGRTLLDEKRRYAKHYESRVSLLTKFVTS